MMEIVITYRSVEQSMRNWKKQGTNLPKSPQNINEFVEVLQNPAAMANFNVLSEKFVHLVPSSSSESGVTVALFTEEFLNKIPEKENIVAYGDGTFKYFPSFVKQLFIIHFKVGRHVRTSKYHHLSK